MGYFDPEPKRRREDFYDMEDLLEEFERAIERGKLVSVLGLRRYGKTSLILTALNEMKEDYVYVDCRLLPSGMIAISDFLKILERDLSEKSWSRKILEGVDGVSIGKLGISIRRRDRETLLEILERLEGRILVLDEAQELRRSGYRFDSLLAYAYDHLDLRIVVSGSQIGLLRRFLRADDPEAPLFGRPILEVRMRRLSEEQAMEFLKLGFEQEGIDVDDEILEQAIERLDGIIGWLTYFGYSMSRGGEAPERIYEKAERLAFTEVEHFLETHRAARERYSELLRIVAGEDGIRWSEAYRALEARLGKIPRNRFAELLRNLVDAGFVQKEGEEYRISDPVLRRGIIKFL